MILNYRTCYLNLQAEQIFSASAAGTQNGAAINVTVLYIFNLYLVLFIIDSITRTSSSRSNFAVRIPFSDGTRSTCGAQNTFSVSFYDLMLRSIYMIDRRGEKYHEGSPRSICFADPQKYATLRRYGGVHMASLTFQRISSCKINDTSMMVP